MGPRDTTKQNSPPTRQHVIITGASGMVGEGVLLTVLGDSRVDSVLVIGRRSCGVAHPKMREIIHADFLDFTPIAEQLAGYNACFFCLGVSSVGMKADIYHRITYDLTMHVAVLLAKLNPSMTFCYVSGTGTDSTEKGRSMWARVKGRTENHLARLPFKSVYAFRPGLIRPLGTQRNVKPLFRVAAWPYPLWRLLFPNSVCTIEDIGNAMVNAAVYGYEKPVLENKDIARCAIARNNTAAR